MRLHSERAPGPGGFGETSPLLLVAIGGTSRTIDGAIRYFGPKRKRYTVFTGAFQQGFPQNLWTASCVTKGT
jgi:hypothetical protein